MIRILKKINRNYFSRAWPRGMKQYTKQAKIERKGTKKLRNRKTTKKFQTLKRTNKTNT